MKRNVIRILVAGVLIGSAFVLSGCYSHNMGNAYQPEPTLGVAPSTSCARCGAITSIERTGGPYGDGDYQLTINLDDGGTRTITQSSQPPFRVGDRVQLLKPPAQ